MVPVEDIGETERPGERNAPVKKAATAFRTISEVADDLHVPQHVLRFWETRFPQVKPLKRGGGRRYYRPDDVVLLRRISDLLYVQGYTIKGVQRLLVEGDGTLLGELPPPDDADRDDEADFPDGHAPLFAQAAVSPPAQPPPQGQPQSQPQSQPHSQPQFRPAAPAVLRSDDGLRSLLEETLRVLEAVRRQLSV